MKKIWAIYLFLNFWLFLVHYMSQGIIPSTFSRKSTLGLSFRQKMEIEFSTGDIWLSTWKFFFLLLAVSRLDSFHKNESLVTMKHSSKLKVVLKGFFFRNKGPSFKGHKIHFMAAGSRKFCPSNREIITLYWTVLLSNTRTIARFRSHKTLAHRPNNS